MRGGELGAVRRNKCSKIRRSKGKRGWESRRSERK